MSHDVSNPVFMGSDQVRHKPACEVSEYGKKLENLDLRRKGILLLM